MTDCIPWTGARFKSGYGQAYYKGKRVRAHRLAWFERYGEWPPDDLHHECDNKLCVNLEHLTPKDASEHRREHQLGKRSEFCKFGHPIEDLPSGRRCVICHKQRCREGYLRSRGKLSDDTNITR